MRWDRLRQRFWAENILAIIVALLAIATVAQPAWIEAVLGLDPDAASGAVEWGLTLLAAGAALASAWLARLEWLRARGAAAN
jgi:hypothetical protein